MGCELEVPQKKVSTPAGLAPAGLDAGPGGVAGNPTPSGAPAGQAAPANNAAVGNNAGGIPAPLTQPNPPAQDDGKGIIGKMTGKVVKLEDYKDKPNFKVVENRPGGDDPLSFSLSAYVSVRSQASLFGIQSALKTFKVVEERNPTYDELMKMMQEHRIEFAALYPWQQYAYDSKTGQVVVIEDTQMKADRYKAAGIQESP